MFTNKKNLFPMCSSFILTLYLSACGGGSSSSDEVEIINSSTDAIETVERVEIIEEVGGLQEFDLIKAYANQETDVAPALRDYVNAGVFGLSSRALDELNDEVLNSTPEEVDTVSELDSLVASLSTTDLIPEISDETISNYLNVINNTRAVGRTCGVLGFFPAVNELTWNAQLYSVAYEHSQDLAESNTFSHDGSGSVSDWTGYPLNIASYLDSRANAYGYEWSSLAENLTAGRGIITPQDAIEEWLNSDSHCSTLMDPDLTEVGMALYIKEGSNLTRYWSQEFGIPR